MRGGPSFASHSTRVDAKQLNINERRPKTERVHAPLMWACIISGHGHGRTMRYMRVLLAPCVPRPKREVAHGQGHLRTSLQSVVRVGARRVSPMGRHHGRLGRGPLRERGGGRGARLVVEAGEVLDVRVHGLGHQMHLQRGGGMRGGGGELVLVTAALVAHTAAAAHCARHATAMTQGGGGVRRRARRRAGGGSPVVELRGMRSRLGAITRGEALAHDRVERAEPRRLLRGALHLAARVSVLGPADTAEEGVRRDARRADQPVVWLEHEEARDQVGCLRRDRALVDGSDAREC
mmetsp:Transcript_36641/g.92891  ORF Transcript_36641/g.92891 Transcript_36641/m.92891 type:complete len:293 (-) Transcript_36641:572-1450(-)